MSGFTIVLLTIIALFALLVLKGVTLVAQGQAAIIERLGKYRTTLEPGLNFIIPVLDKTRDVRSVNNPFAKDRVSNKRVDLREQLLNVEKLDVITKDNVRMEVDTLVFYQIMEPFKSVYEINNPVRGIDELSKTTVRNVFGEMDLDQSLASREDSNTKLRSVLDEATDKWGIKVLRVEIQDIKPPQDLVETMKKQMTAERERREKVIQAEAEKRESILLAEGENKSTILRAEAAKQDSILRAEGEAKATILSREAEAKGIQMVEEAKAKGFDAVRDSLSVAKGTEGVVALETLKTQEIVAEKLASSDNSTFFLPNELAGLSGAIGSLKEILNATGKK